MKTFGYSKPEKLKHKKYISLLFEKGRWKSCGNVRIIYFNFTEALADISIPKNQKVGVSVSKRNFKKAVDRNRVKRLLRECYRLNKNEYISAFGEQSLAMIFWTSPKLPQNFQEAEQEFLNLCKSKK